jgi:putative acetyltransferase
VIVRPETPADYEAIAAVVRAAFVDEPQVADVVAAIRASAEYRPTFSLVAEEDGAIVGHVMLSGLPIDGERALQLSPLAVHPDRQRRGVGRALVHEALAAAAKAGERLVCVEGDPRYYSRFGFRVSTELGVERPHEGVPEWAFQALALADDHPRGRATYPPAFDIVS